MLQRKVLTSLAIAIMAGLGSVGSLVLGQLAPPHQAGEARQERSDLSGSGQISSRIEHRRHFSLDLDDLRTKARQHASIRVQGVPIAEEQVANLQLQRFRITTPETRFVSGRKGGSDHPIDFNPDSVLLLRGTVEGHSNSTVFLALTNRGESSGTIDFGDGHRPLTVASKRDASGNIIEDQLSVFPRREISSLPAGIRLCGAEEPETTSGDPLSKSAGGITPSTLGRRVIELAVETDNELYVIAGNNDQSVNEYIVKLYGMVSDIYIRDVNTQIVLSYVRLWDDPNDLFNELDPLIPFKDYWNVEMDTVERDAAQFISGRRDLPYGGVAWLSALCGNLAYSVCGYFNGVVPDTMDSSVDHYDVHVAAHELGHNCGANHTHWYGFDTCDNFNGTPQRGTIMSYCSQTMSGGNALTDIRFHAGVQPYMVTHIQSELCIVTDCNENGVHDADDIAGAVSDDLNVNGVPDECEDCNANHILDDMDIAGATSTDIDGNGVPDECEPDCNENSVPDAWDISTGFSTDLYGNNIPDECETDCNSNGISDYTEIILDMTLDLDRDAILDACQDCDSNGTTDIDQLSGANSIWAASDLADHLKEFHPISGVRMDDSTVGMVMQGHDVLVSPDGRVLVSSGGDDRIVEFDRFGAYIGDFVTAGLGGLDIPSSMTFGPNGNLFVCSVGNSSVIEYDGQTGALVGVFVDPPPIGRALGTPPALQPWGLAFGPNGNLFVTSFDHQVLEFDGLTGDFVSVFVDAADNGTLDSPRQILFLPDGNLVVASFLTKELLLFDGVSGAPLGKFNNGGTDAALTFDEPWGLRLGPDGFLYASRHGAITELDDDVLPDDIAELHINSTRIYKYDAATGNFIRSLVIGNDTGLDGPTGFDFMPGDGFDCNFNLLPDSCDIAAGSSLDINDNQVPDECECPPDIDASGQVDVFDLIPLLSNWGSCPDPCPPTCEGDIIADCEVDVLDLIELLSAWGGC